MGIFSIPIFASALVAGLIANTKFSGAYFLISVFVTFSWALAYSKSLRWFRRIDPPKPTWQFIVPAAVLQLAAIVFLFWLVV
mgnify:CR=1